MKRNEIRLSPVVFIALFFFMSAEAFAQPRFESYGAWKVAPLHDYMDLNSHVLMRTTFASSERGAREGQDVDATFGFRIFGGVLMSLDASHAFGRNSWPSCDLDSSSYSIDGSPTRRIASIQIPGSCNAVPMDGELVQSLQQGGVAYVRLNRRNGYISLEGFADAWERARELAR